MAACTNTPAPAMCDCGACCGTCPHETRCTFLTHPTPPPPDPARLSSQGLFAGPGALKPPEYWLA